jgi:hypothetical protein
MTDQEFKALKVLKKSDFNFPEKMKYGIVAGLDYLLQSTGWPYEILSDYRPYDAKNPNSQHYFGRAIDVFFPGIDPLAAYDTIKKSDLFDGIGVYVNEAGVVSYHLDTRGFPAGWGGVITRPIDPDTGRSVKRIDYVSAETVLNIIKKKGAAILVLLAIIGIILIKSK